MFPSGVFEGSGDGAVGGLQMQEHGDGCLSGHAWKDALLRSGAPQGCPLGLWLGTSVLCTVVGLCGRSGARVDSGVRSDLPSGRPVDRDSELVALERALAAVCAGAGSGVLLQSPAGLGKSRLLDEAVTLAAARGVR